MIYMFKEIHCYLLMYLKALEINVLRCMNLMLLIFICTWINIARLFKTAEIKLELLTNIDMVLINEKGIRGIICHAIYRYAKANKKYLKIYDEKRSSYIQNVDASNLYG